MTVVDYRQVAEKNYWYMEGMRAMRVKCWCAVAGWSSVAFALGAIFF